MKNFVLFFVAFLSFVAFSLGLECYSCYPSLPDGRSCTRKDDAIVKRCDNGEELCVKVESNGVVTRDCFLDTIGRRESGCRFRGSSIECYCYGNYCNSAPAPMASALMALLLPLSLSWLISKH